MTTTTTMPDLKTQEAKLNANIALNDYSLALENSCQSTDVIMAAMDVRRLMLSITEQMASDLIDAIDNEFDETRVHYHMTDCLLEIMHELVRRVDQEDKHLPAFNQFFKKGVKPKDLLTVSQWADRNRFLESGTNLPGRWNTNNAPHLKDIMDDFSLHSPVEQITLMKSSGVGGTEALYNMLGYVMDHVQNKDVMVVVPTLELRDRSLNPRVDRLINETPGLKHINVGSKKKSANRMDLLEFSAVGRLIKTGANSDEAARMDHVAYLLGDEVASWKSSSTEGDRVKLFKNRLRTMTRHKIFFVSSPVDLEDYICVEFDAGDQRYRHVPCPHCGEYQKLEFGGKDKPYGLKWRLKITEIENEKIVDSAWYLCKHCQCVIEEYEKDAMLDKGRWVPTYPHRKKHHSYQINALYIKHGLGWTWTEIAQDFLNSINSTEALKTFEQTTLGLPWQDKGDQVDAGPLMLRRETYEGKPWVIETAGVDVQKDRLEVGFEGWAAGEENWKIDFIIIPGDTAKIDVWDELEQVLAQHSIKIVLIDSGYNTSMVYDFVKKHKYAVATKGLAGQRPLIEDEKKRKQRLRVKRKKGVPIEPLGVDQGKAIVYSRLKQTQPGPGYIHFSDDPAFDAEYFAQLTAEILVQRAKGLRKFYEWKQLRARNEALDIAVLNLAAIKLLNINWSDVGVRASVVARPQSESVRAPSVIKTSKPKNKFAKDDWLDR